MFIWDWFTGLFKKPIKIGPLPEKNRIALDRIRKRRAEQTTISFIINPEMLADLKRKGGHSTNKDLINSALTIYQWALNSIGEGRIIASVNERDESYRELSMPIFEKLKEQTPWGTWNEGINDEEI